MINPLTSGGRLARAALRALAALVLLVPAALIPGTAQAASGENCRYSLVGTWHARVETSLPSSGETTFVFREDGTIEPPEGEPVTDTWQPVDCHRFTYVIVHPRVNAEGVVVGEVRGHQDGYLGRDRFYSSGTSVIYDLDGEPVSSFTVRVWAERVQMP
ncbi:MAG TPA: hypothetical protein VF174_17360 [Micromonosporaceae bacterium]